MEFFSKKNHAIINCNLLIDNRNRKLENISNLTIKQGVFQIEFRFLFEEKMEYYKEYDRQRSSK